MLDKLSSKQHERLCRISQQGMGQAARMLSQLLGQSVAVEVAEVWMSDRRLPAAMSPADRLGVSMQVDGDISGGLLLSLSDRCASWLAATLLQQPVGEALLVEPASSTLKEVGNIMASSFLGSIDDQLGLRCLPAPPVLSRAPVETLLSASLPDNSKACLIVRTQLLGLGGSEPLQGDIYLFSDPAALQQLLERI